MTALKKRCSCTSRKTRAPRNGASKAGFEQTCVQVQLGLIHVILLELVCRSDAWLRNSLRGNFCVNLADIESQALGPALVPIEQLSMVEAHQPKNGGVKIVDV